MEQDGARDKVTLQLLFFFKSLHIPSKVNKVACRLLQNQVRKRCFSWSLFKVSSGTNKLTEEGKANPLSYRKQNKMKDVMCRKSKQMGIQSLERSTAFCKKKGFQLSIRVCWSTSLSSNLTVAVKPEVLSSSELLVFALVLDSSHVENLAPKVIIIIILGKAKGREVV